jgi:5-methylthioribose kinase
MVDYEFLTAETVPDYIRSRPELDGVVDPDTITSVEEVGDGNLNLVFIVTDAAGKSVVLKQALPYVRLVGPDWPMTPTRAAKEAHALRTHSALAPTLVPETYFFCDKRYVIGMENLSGFRVWRGALIDGLRHDGVAADMGRYVAEVAFGTSVFFVDSEEHKRLMAQSINPELCKISEDLVFTEPHDDIGRNAVLPANEADAAEHARDQVMRDAMGEAKWIFMTKAEALIHGDLHTGSVMVRAHSGSGGPAESKAFDSEFAFYGPVAFDIGALWANYTLSAARWVALGDDDMAAWVLNLVDETWSAFEERFRALYPGRSDARVWSDATLENVLAQWRNEAWLFAAAKMSRRIVGLAKAADIETLDPSLREGAARGVLRLARQLVVERHQGSQPSRFIHLASQVLHENKTA